MMMGTADAIPQAPEKVSAAIDDGEKRLGGTVAEMGWTLHV